MSIFSLSRFSSSSVRVLVDLIAQVLLVMAAAAGVILIAGGCGPNPQQLQQMQMQGRPTASSPPQNQSPPMAAPLVTPPDAALSPEPFAGPVVTPARTPGVAPHATPGQQAAGQSPTGSGAQLGGGNAPRLNPRGASALDGAASPKEQRLAKRENIDQTLNSAMVPPAAPAPRGGLALRAAENAVSPLSDTLAAIDTAQRAVVENLQNTEVPGYKATRTACGDGRNVTSQIDLTQGELQATQRALDVAIQGDGFLQIRVFLPGHKEGTPGYTRNGSLRVAKDNQLVVGQGDGQEGYKLLPPIGVPVGTTELTISPDGTVRAIQGGAEKPGPAVIGRLSLARFTDPTALQPMGAGIYTESDASGPAVDSLPNERGAGSVLQGYLESSNVDLIKERLRLRFLQGWRANILAAIDGETGSGNGNGNGATSRGTQTP